MTAPTTSWNLVRVYGTWRGMDGTLKAGTYKVTIPARITNVTDDAIIPAGTFATGALQTTVSGSPSLDLLVPATDDPDNAETGWKVTVTVNFTDAAGESYVIDVPVASRPTVDGGNGLGVNLRTCAMPSAIPQQVALYKVGVPGGLAQLDSIGQVIDSDGNPVTGGGVTDWADLTGKPTNFPPDLSALSATVQSLLAASSATAARTAIGAGTSSLQLGSGPTTAKAGDYVPTYAEITGKPSTFPPTIGATGSTAVAGNDARLTDARTPTAHTHPASQVSDSTAIGRSVLTAADAAAARTALGAGTSSLALGTTGSTAKAGNYAPTLADIPAGSILAAPLDGSVNTVAGTARPSARTDIFFRWRSTVQPTNMLTGDEWLVAP